MIPDSEAAEDGPEKTKTMITLDKTKFREQLQVRAICVPKQHADHVSKMLGRFTLNRPKVKHVIPDPKNGENRLILLGERTEESGMLEEKIAELKRDFLVNVVPHEIDLDYKYFTVGVNDWCRASIERNSSRRLEGACSI